MLVVVLSLLSRQRIVAQTAKWSEKQGARGAAKSKEELKREEAECVGGLRLDCCPECSHNPH